MDGGVVSMIIRLRNGLLLDGSQSRQGDIYLVDGIIQNSVDPGSKIYADYNVENCVIAPGAIDLHTHIGGGKINLARLLLPELVRHPSQLSVEEHGIKPLSAPVPTSWETGLRYLQMGYTTCLEPAVLPANARMAHSEMSDIPWLDTGGYLLLGNDRLLLNWIAAGVPQSQITAYVGWMLKSHQCCGIKVVNAGGIDAFKFNARQLDVDDTHPRLPITPRTVLRVLSQAVEELRLTHPLHVHCSNLGVPGNIESTLATLDAVEGRRIHLTHAQYHCYGKEGKHGFSSEAYRLAEYVNWNPQVSIDIGQVIFGQTVTLSADSMHQFDNRHHAKPKKVIFQDLECQAGCGVVPFRYRHEQFVHGLQWTIGLELSLRILDPSRVFLTTDHPNGGPFTAYPHLIRLLMDYDYRMSIFDQLHPDVKETSPLPSLKREYSLQEIITMTRTGPAKSLGLADRGSLQPGTLGDVVVYEQDSNIEKMFTAPKMVFRRGVLVCRDGSPLKGCDKATVIADPETESTFESWIAPEWREQYGYDIAMVKISRDELLERGRHVAFAKLRKS
jgi:formylmethanofuran dehydrogenase subunit A